MSKSRKDLVTVQGAVIAIVQQDNHDFISLTDIAKYKKPDHADDVTRNWLRNRNTLELPGVWEHLNNPGFNPVEFDGIKTLAGLNSFTLTPKQWIEQTGTVGNGLAQGKRLTHLNQIAIRQMRTLTATPVRILTDNKDGQP